MVVACSRTSADDVASSIEPPSPRPAVTPSPPPARPTSTLPACPKKRPPMNRLNEMGFDDPIDISDVPQQTCIVVKPGHVWCRGRIVSMDGEHATDDERHRLRYANGRDWVQIRGITDAVEIVVDTFNSCVRRS